jgi:sugar/nucleoside kinase (ribokinase family)
MNILVIGHSVVDKIIERDNISIKPGGIFYTAISLLSQIEKGDKVNLCTNIDKRSEGLFKEVYDKIQNDFITIIASIPQVELLVDDTGERKETYTEISQNLRIPTNDLHRFDGVLINMISGNDISLAQLIELRKNFVGTIYFDVHTLSRGIDKNLNRNFRRIDDFNKWAKCIDILQVNESELLTLSDQKDETKIVEKLFALGIKQFIVTKAELGATVYFINNEGKIKSCHKDAIQVKIKNKVGCGDVFGAVYFYNYIKNKNILAALELANVYAGISTTYSEVNELLNLNRDAIKQIGKK